MDEKCRFLQFFRKSDISCPPTRALDHSLANEMSVVVELTEEQFEALLDQAGGGKGLEPVLAQ